MNFGQKFLQLAMSFIMIFGLLAPAAMMADGSAPAMHPALLQAALEAPQKSVRVIVLKAGNDDRAESLTERLGGAIYRDLRIINAFAAEMPALAAKELSRSEAVSWVTPDGQITLSAMNNEQEIYYLFNDPMTPAGDTPSHGVLPLDMAQPAPEPLYNYDAERDGLPGLTLQPGGSGAFETDPAKIQRWQLAPFSEDYELQASVRLKIYAVMQGFQPGLYGKVNAYLIDRAGANATVVDSASFENSSWPENWSRRTVDFNAIEYTFSAGHQLEIAITVDASSQAPMMFAYGQAAQPAHLLITQRTDWPVYYLDTIGAPDVWAQGYQGDGVTVAVIDSGAQKGIADLRQGSAKRVIAEVNLNPNYTNAWDNFGHGMYVHGLIGSNGAVSGGLYMGVAPAVNFANVRVNDEFGMASESDVVAGMQWVLDNKDAYNIRVVNLSLNSSVAQPYHLSPLDLALEILWFNGVTVVVAGGNNGDDDPGVIYPPANDPFAIAVGSVDDMTTADPSDDQLAAFSAFGTTLEGYSRPDLVAPGTNLVSSMHSQSRFRWEYPEHVIQTIGAGGKVNNTHFLASGTSSSAAVVSGAVALLLDAQPNLTPDQIKWLLNNTTTPLPGREGVGAGLLNVDNLVDTALSYSDPADIPSANQGNMPHMALAKMALVAYWASVNDGEIIDWNLVNWNAVNWNAVNWNAVNWNAVNWNAVNWNAVDWDGIDWSSVNWNSVNWNAVNWNAVNWNAVNWNSVNWNAVNWNSIDLDY